MSSPSDGNTFQGAAWQKVGAPNSAQSKERVPTVPGSRWEGLSGPSKKTATAPEFISPYISPEKLRLLNAAARQGAPEPEPEPEPEPVAEPEPLPDPQEIRREAFEQGFTEGEAAGKAEGLAAGLAEGQRQAGELIGRMETLLSDIGKLWPDLLAEYERQLLDLVFHIAEKVVYGRIEVDQEVVKRAILNAFSVIPEPVGVTVEVNPLDYDYIETIKEDFFEHIASLKDIAVSAVASVSRGGCIVRTRSGEVDAGLEGRLDAVRKSLIAVKGRVRN